MLTPRQTEIPIYQGDDLARLADLHREAMIAERRAAIEREDALSHADGGSRRVGDPVPTEVEAAFQAAIRPSRDAYDSFVDEAVERAIVVKLNNIGRKEFRALVAAHPPRMVAHEGGEKVHEDDDGFGVNVETFSEALLLHEGTIVDPEWSEKERSKFLDGLADGDFDKLWLAAYALNRSPGADPKGSRFSLDSPSSIET